MRSSRVESPGRAEGVSARSTLQTAEPHFAEVAGFHDASEGSAATARGPTTKPRALNSSAADPDRVGGQLGVMVIALVPWE